MELVCCEGVWGVQSWATGFRAPGTVRCSVALLREAEFSLKEAEIAEQQGRKDAAEYWLNEAIAAEASAKARGRAAA